MNGELCRQVSLGHVPKIYKDLIRGFHDLLREATLSVDIVGVEFTDSCHPDEGGVRFLRNVGSYKSHMA
jgi:hypothetical protein